MKVRKENKGKLRPPVKIKVMRTRPAGKIGDIEIEDILKDEKRTDRREP